MSVCYVYIIAPDCEKPEHCKVGISADPASRLRGVQTGSPIKLKLWYAFKFPNREMAAWIERAVHALCEEEGWRLEGEWISAEPLDAMQYIDSKLFDYVEEVMLPGISLHDEMNTHFDVSRALEKYCGLEPLMSDIFFAGAPVGGRS